MFSRLIQGYRERQERRRGRREEQRIAREVRDKIRGFLTDAARAIDDGVVVPRWKGNSRDDRYWNFQLVFRGKQIAGSYSRKDPVWSVTIDDVAVWRSGAELVLANALYRYECKVDAKQREVDARKQLRDLQELVSGLSAPSGNGKDAGAVSLTDGVAGGEVSLSE